MQVPQLGEGAEEMTKIRTWLRGLPGADAKDQGASYPEDIPELFRLLLIPGVRLWGSMCGGFCSSSFGPASAPNRVRGLPHRRSAVAWSAVPNRVRGLSHRRSVVAWSAVPNRVRGLPHRRSVVAWSAVPNRVRGLPHRRSARAWTLAATTTSPPNRVRRVRGLPHRRSARAWTAWTLAAITTSPPTTTVAGPRGLESTHARRRALLRLRLRGTSGGGDAWALRVAPLPLLAPVGPLDDGSAPLCSERKF